ncbi:MAG: STAS domain-containing protein [Chloroflexota bacterium]
MAQTASDDTTAALPAYPTWGEAVGDRAVDRLAYRRIRSWMEQLARRGLRIEVDRESGRTVLHLHGRLDAQSAPALKKGFQELLPLASRYIDVDLAAIDRVDGVGLAALVWAWRLTQDHGLELRLTRMRPYVREIVSKMNLHHLLQIVDGREFLLIAE